MKRWVAMAAVVAVMGAGVPAWADSSHGDTITNHITNQGGQGGAGGTGIGIGVGGNASSNSGASASATSHNTNTNVNTNVNTQGQGQSQGQRQGQGQAQGQKQSADNKGVSQSVNVESSLIPGVAVAPGLAAGGSQVCLGSFSVGLSGPMAGVAFGKTVVDKGCEKRQLYIILHNTQDPRAAAVLDSLYRDAMGDEAPKQAAKIDTTIPDLKLSTPLGQPKAALVTAAPTVPVASVQGGE